MHAKLGAFLSILILATGCNLDEPQFSITSVNPPVPSLVGEISPPEGYLRKPHTTGDFTQWLRNQRLKKDRTVYLYNGQKKANQDAQYAVLDIPVGTQDLQQCADAVMRMRASWLFDRKRYQDIRFCDGHGKWYAFQPPYDRLHFEQYLKRVFSYCGSASLARQLEPVSRFRDIQPGDVLIRGGYPGHAVMVMDMAENDLGEKVFLLAQSFMPAQDIHILKNPLNTGGSPWYRLPAGDRILTPEYSFHTTELMRWQ